MSQNTKESVELYMKALETRMNGRLSLMVPYDIDPRWVEPKQCITMSKEQREIFKAYNTILQFPKYLLTRFLERLPRLTGIEVVTSVGSKTGPLDPIISLYVDGNLLLEITAKANYHTTRKHYTNYENVVTEEKECILLTPDLLRLLQVYSLEKVNLSEFKVLNVPVVNNRITSNTTGYQTISFEFSPTTLALLY